MSKHVTLKKKIQQLGYTNHKYLHICVDTRNNALKRYQKRLRELMMKMLATNAYLLPFVYRTSCTTISTTRHGLSPCPCIRTWCSCPSWRGSEMVQQRVLVWTSTRCLHSSLLPQHCPVCSSSAPAINLQQLLLQLQQWRPQCRQCRLSTTDTQTRSQHQLRRRCRWVLVVPVITCEYLLVVVH